MKVATGGWVTTLEATDTQRGIRNKLVSGLRGSLGHIFTKVCRPGAREPINALLSLAFEGARSCLSFLGRGTAAIGAAIDVVDDISVEVGRDVLPNVVHGASLLGFLCGSLDRL